MSRTRFLILVVVLLCGIGTTFGLVGNPFRRAGYRPLTRALAEFPAELVDESATPWRGVDRGLPAGVAETTGPDEFLRRDYRAPDGRVVQLYVTYHGNLDAGIDTIYHTPTVCFPVHGFELTEELRLDAGETPVTRYRFTKGALEFVVLNFFVLNGQRIARSPREDPMAVARGRLSPGSGPGYYAQVQVIAETSTGGEDAGATALAFLRAAADRLIQHF